MSYIPPASLLRGLSVATAQLFGMPCAGAHYATRQVRSNRLDDDALCVFCRRRATNAHHVPPVGMGSRNATFTLHGYRLRPALIALCGSGTTGCHGDCHSGRMRIEWVWDSDEFARAWWSGDLLKELGPASRMLYEFGHWKLTKEDTGTVVRLN